MNGEVYELGWGFHLHIRKIFKKVKRVFKRVAKTVKKVAKGALNVAAGVVGGALYTAVSAADQYVSQYQPPPSPSSPSRPRPRPRPRVKVVTVSAPRPTNTHQGGIFSDPNVKKYLPLALGIGAILLLRGK